MQKGCRMSLITSDEGLAELLGNAKTIALVGASPKEERPSHRVMAYLQKVGYKVVPINPGQAGKQILGETVYARLGDLDMPVDMVDIFRRSEYVGEIIDEAIAINAASVWMQLGISNADAAATASSAGLDVVMNRCTKIEHERLLA